MTETPVNPETIVPGSQQAAVDELVEAYRKANTEQAAKVTQQEENVMNRLLSHDEPILDQQEKVTGEDPLRTPAEPVYEVIWDKPQVSNSVVDKARRYEQQEAKRAPKIQVDQSVILLSWIIAVGIAFISSAIVSFNGITAVATFVGLSGEWMSGLFFFFIELMYLVFLVAYLVLASRVDDDGKPEKTWGAMAGMISFGGIAVLANGFHTLDFWAWDISNPQVWAGVVLSVAAPIAIISASKMASRVVFARALKL